MRPERPRAHGGPQIASKRQAKEGGDVVFQAPLCHERASEPAKDRLLKLLPDVDSSPSPARRKRATVVSPGSSAAASIRIGINLFLTVRGCLSFLDYRDQRVRLWADDNTGHNSGDEEVDLDQRYATILTSYKLWLRTGSQIGYPNSTAHHGHRGLDACNFTSRLTTSLMQQ